MKDFQREIVIEERLRGTWLQLPFLDPYIALQGFWDYDGRAGLENFEAPIIFLAGERDLVFTPHMAQVQSKYFPKSDAMTIPGSGHLVMIEQPEWIHCWVLALHNS